MNVRRIELITGPGSYSGRRRRWLPDVKARILFESFEPGANISEVARRNGLTPQQLFGWRQQAQASNGRSAGAPERPSLRGPSAFRFAVRQNVVIETRFAESLLNQQQNERCCVSITVL